jgi:tetratricopeptide (TPR) repeat protein
MTHVFVSYSRRDKEYVVDLSGFLQQAGIDVFYDSNIGYSAQWWTTIVERVNACAAMIVVMTPALDSSDWVMKEILLARRSNKPVFPLLLEGDGYPLLIDVQHLDVTSRAMPGMDFVDAVRAALTTGSEITKPSTPPPRSDVVGERIAVRSDLDIDALARKVERAHETLEAWRRLDPARAHSPAMLFLKARAFDDLAEIEQCLTTCDEVLAIDPAHADAQVLKADQLNWLGFQDEPLALLSEVLAKQPNRVDALIVQADIIRTHELQGGEPLIDRALALEPDNASALAVKGMYLSERQDMMAADRLISRASELGPESIYPIMARIEYAFGNDSHAEASEEIQALIRIFPQWPLPRILDALAQSAVLMEADELGPEQVRRTMALSHRLISIGLEIHAPIGLVCQSVGHLMLSAVHFRQSDMMSARAELDIAMQLAPDTFPSAKRELEAYGAGLKGITHDLSTADLTTLFQQLGPATDYYTAPNIPARKLANARDSCALKPDDIVLALINCTFFGSAKNCILFTESSAVQFHSQLSGNQRTKLPYRVLDTARYEARGEKVVDPDDNGIWFTTEGSAVSAGFVIVVLDTLKARMFPQRIES